MKSFYNEYEALNDDGRQANGEIHRFMDDLFNRWIAMGFGTRELQSIVSEELIATSAEKRLVKAVRMKRDLDKRKTFVRGNKTTAGAPRGNAK